MAYQRPELAEILRTDGAALAPSLAVSASGWVPPPRDHVTAVDVTAYMKTHPLADRRYHAERRSFEAPAPPEFLAVTQDGENYLLRWPNRQVRWERRVSLEQRGFPPPPETILGTYVFGD